MIFVPITNDIKTDLEERILQMKKATNKNAGLEIAREIVQEIYKLKNSKPPYNVPKTYHETVFEYMTQVKE